MLHNRRKRQEALAREEAEGKTFWTDKFETPARIKLWHAFTEACPSLYDRAASARAMICRDEGLFKLTERNLGEAEDFLQYVMTCADEMVPTCIEAMLSSLYEEAQRYAFYYSNAGTFADRVRVILREHRISFDLIERRMVEFSSQEMHEAVVGPTLRLLAGRRGFEGVERAYQEALEEISHGKPADAITDAGTALQEMLTALDCEGNALGPLTKSARKRDCSRRTTVRWRRPSRS
ncbi:hypothetical protein GCM10023328_22710 [Modestobacter marinus]|uniref:Uncharacterized protein n=1 Tax=Modestobacter marinus TaxID=477641 RepID=A0A846LUV8_9ACTN|nr:hypothetical protein [Modestobacter marinus]NIH70152.1 hypothetical protein [Modestobacter marinus]GGL84329.1 hypothetical protein GCM10011589_46040 [Modestobacter marinus]